MDGNFGRKKTLKKKSLKDILDWFRERELTSVLTMRRLGAIGTFKDLDCLFIANPLTEADEIVDTTGSGDAFAAGMVSYLCDKRHFDDSDFMKAMQRGRVWASCACKSRGGIGKEPDEELKKFLRENPDYEKKAIETKTIGHAKEFIEIIDRAHW
jgi:sugar/nucleoside kinase (ribokinase family)